MKKLIYIAMIAAVAFAVTGCAGMMPVQQTQKKEGAVRTEKYGYVDKQNSSMGVYGASTYEIVEPVSWEDKHKCSVLDFVSYATLESDNKLGAQDVINVRAEELCKTVDGEKKCSCKYWGLGIRYKMLSMSEAKEVAPTAEKLEAPVSEEQ